MRRIHRHLTDLTPDGATAHAQFSDRRTATAYAEKRAGIFELTEGLLRLDAARMSRPLEVIFQNSHGGEGYLTGVTEYRSARIIVSSRVANRYVAVILAIDICFTIHC